MNVKELKEFLENLPDDSECLAYESDCTYTGKIYYEELSVGYDKEHKEVKFS